MKAQILTIKGLLVNEADRNADSAEIDGKLVSWEAGHFLTVLPFGSKKGTAARKYRVAPESEPTVKAILSEVNWGALVTLEIDENMVSSVTVECDWAESI